MIYLNEKNITEIGIDWNKLIDIIESASKCLGVEDFAQPVKPYLRYRDLKNRIIAMPAFIGGDFNMAGIKWIASFPDNIKNGIPRAHSVVILNKAETGEPVGIINTALLSILRTASVTGLMIRYFEKVRPLKNINLGIIGWGPIGQYHFKMCTTLFGNRLAKIFLYDLRKIDKMAVDFAGKDKIIIANSWEEAYNEADVFITCTVSNAPYIDKKPKKGSLQLNVSLRDYKTDIFDYVKNSIIVDNWEEVCREKTDIEMLHIEKGLQAKDTKSIIDVVMNQCMKDYPEDVPIMFNPMGMAVFDMALGAYYLDNAKAKNIGEQLL
ncbi:MAG: 2,3-diaminopropionate biosynthesis protein SbnB [Acidobacteria bacterium]|jgi:ornithine cyclodeaminase|nr:2,3-diaminopropionate biosynthesis protein SbnB [Acidobacteriota bacterium]